MDSSLRPRPWEALLTVGLVAYVLWTSWLRWPDVVVDFGRELYVPWQLNEGRALYRDISYFNGPLSPWINAGLFRMAGESLWNLFALNLAILLGITAALWTLAGRMAGRMAALMSVVLFLSIHAASKFTIAGNYNFMAPYSHEVTHGLALCLLSMMLLWRYLNGGSGVWLTLIGGLLGLLFLGKPEFFLATAIGVAMGVAASQWISRAQLGTALKVWRNMGASGLVIVFLAWVRLSLQTDSGIAFEGILGAWPHIFGSEVTGLDFYTRGMGFDDPWGNTAKLALITAAGSVVFVPTALAAFRLFPRRASPLGTGVIAGGLLLSLALAFAMRANLFDLARPLPLLVLVVLSNLAVRLNRDRSEGHYDPTGILALSISVSALLLMLKMLLHTRFYHYGFVLTVPAVLVLVTLLTEWIPEWIRSRGGWALLFRAVSVSLLVALAVAHLIQSRENLQAITTSVGDGTDRFYADDRGALVHDLTRVLDTIVSPEQTLAVLPEGVMVNYLIRRANPTPYFSFMPPEVLMFGEERMLTSFQEASPDWIVVFNRSASEYGFTQLGQDYGTSLMTWIKSEYELFDVLTDPRRRGRQFSTALIYKHPVLVALRQPSQ